MPIRTYYWAQRNVSLYKYYKYKFREPNRFVFKKGNAGDIFNIDLIKFLYQDKPINIKDEGRRLLLVGSIINKIQYGDLICGIGWKGNDLNSKSKIIESLEVHGVRGPLTRSLFEKHGNDLSKLKFEYDPGLLLKEVYNLNLKKSSNSQITFIPHFQDINIYKGKYPKNIKFINIDNTPKNIAKEILKSEIVYASSLHGIIFSHALNKPCVFVKPQTNEPLFKYRDYYLSVGLELPDGLKSIESVNVRKDKPTILNKSIGLDDFHFPDIQSLKNKNIITNV
ncbi:polysaccharide pyruvyl transferase family protein [Winogradskyella sp.]|uniref:polysaccharide pyruvyl transferase family protein n=1 Tax=Winogradskyella sp. TaxID=1883156 RepID=UPI0035C862E8